MRRMVTVWRNGELVLPTPELEPQQAVLLLGMLFAMGRQREPKADPLQEVEWVGRQLRARQYGPSRGNVSRRDGVECLVLAGMGGDGDA